MSWFAPKNYANIHLFSLTITIFLVPTPILIKLSDFLAVTIFQIELKCFRTHKNIQDPKLHSSNVNQLVCLGILIKWTCRKREKSERWHSSEFLHRYPISDSWITPHWKAELIICHYFAGLYWRCQTITNNPFPVCR